MKVTATASINVWLERPAESVRRIRGSQKVHLDLPRAHEIVRRHGGGPEFRRAVADRCLMCGGCAYLCPTCTCYNIVDHPSARGRGVRLRLWDTCILGGFTREASGHNPREPHSARCAFRYLHKLGGTDTKNLPFRCVGCGRCAQACIARLGIINVVRALLAASGDAAQEAGGMQ